MTIPAKYLAKCLALIMALGLGPAIMLAQDSSKLGFSPKDKKAFDDAVASADMTLYFGIALGGAGVLFLIIGVIYQLRKKKKSPAA